MSKLATIILVIDSFALGIYLRHGPEAQSVFITFAGAFLVKVSVPECSAVGY